MDIPAQDFMVAEVSSSGGYIDVDMIAMPRNFGLKRCLITYHPDHMKWFGMVSAKPLADDPFSDAEMLLPDIVDQLVAVYAESGAMVGHA